MPKKSPTLRQQWSQIMSRIRSHWRGELSLWDALTHCIMLIALPMLAAIPIGIVGGLLNGVSERTFDVILHLGAGTSLLGVAWWCKGMFTMSNQLLSNQRMLPGLVAFLLPIPVAWELIGSWSPTFVHSVDRELVQVQRHAEQPQTWQKHPASVIGVPELHRLSLSGDLGWGSAKALTQAMDAHPELRLIELDSNGGVVHEANVMVDLIQKRNLDTLVRGKCASACTELFLSGRRRFVGPDARFGFHQSGYAGRKHDTVWSITEYESSIFYRSKGVSQKFADAALNESYYGVWRPNVLDVKRSGFATDWWSDRPKEYE